MPNCSTLKYFKYIGNKNTFTTDGKNVNKVKIPPAFKAKLNRIITDYWSWISEK